MALSKINQSTFSSRLTDLAVLIVSFMLFVLLMDIKVNLQLLLDMAFYVSVVFICLRLARRLIFENVHNPKRIIKVLLGNISGLVSGVILTILVGQFIPLVSLSIVVVVLASILAFFILGTLSPLIKSSCHDKIIHQ